MLAPPGIYHIVIMTPKPFTVHSRCVIIPRYIAPALSEKRVLYWFLRMVKGSTWNLLLFEPG